VPNWTNKSNQVTEMLRTSAPRCVVAVFLIIAVTGCEKKRGEAVVIAKEHIDAALPTAETPNAQSATTPEAELRPMADDEIAVDGYVMKPEVRRYESRSACVKPRALDRESANPRQQPHHPSPGRSRKIGRNYERTIGSKSGIARASIPEPFGQPRLSESGAHLKLPRIS